MTFIIAEAGSNHNGSIDNAFKLIDVAVEAGCDAVKFQTFAADTLFAKNTPDFANYKNIRQIIKDNELPRSWHRTLKQYCDDNGIEFMSTPFDEAAVDELVELGVKRLKVAGFESTDPRFLKYVAKAGLPLIVSLGIKSAKYSIWCKIYDNIRSMNDKELTLLHCNNAYPTPYADINLNELKALSLFTMLKRQESNLQVQNFYGLSDHTIGSLVPSLAVTMGATCIEKHFTLDNNMPGPDHHFAVNPTQLKEMVNNIRIAEQCLTYRTSDFTMSEEAFKVGTRSVVAKTPIKAGDILSEENITTKRPCPEGAVEAANFFDLIGKSVNVDIEQDDFIMESYL